MESEVPYCIYKSPPIVPILGQINSEEPSLSL